MENTKVVYYTITVSIFSKIVRHLTIVNSGF